MAECAKLGADDYIMMLGRESRTRTGWRGRSQLQLQKHDGMVLNVTLADRYFTQQTEKEGALLERFSPRKPFGRAELLEHVQLHLSKATQARASRKAGELKVGQSEVLQAGC